MLFDFYFSPLMPVPLILLPGSNDISWVPCWGPLHKAPQANLWVSVHPPPKAMCRHSDTHTTHPTALEGLGAARA